MNKELITRILIQLEPSLSKEFGLAIAKDEKKFKALKIIIDKRVDMILLVHACRVGYGFDFYNYRCEGGYELTQEEFDLLREVYYEKEKTGIL